MGQIYYFCLNYLGVPFFAGAFGRSEKRSVFVQSLFSAAAEPPPKKSSNNALRPHAAAQ
jgi:hypothetical protein